MFNIFVLTTHHKKPERAAEAWVKHNVCAIGYVRIGDLSKVDPDEYPLEISNFMEISMGDIILAYTKKNRIAFVGEVVDGKYIYNDENIIGKPIEDGGFWYPNQKQVKWFNEPNDFSRYDLPRDLNNQMGKRGKTVIKLDKGKRSFEKIKDIILTCAESGSLSFKGNEDMIKSGLGKFLHNNLDSLEEGLRIMSSEDPVSDKNRPDFIALDSSDNYVLIECKGTAHPDACEQLERYGKSYENDSRLMLVAFNITNDCRIRARKNPKIELIECDLLFQQLL